jgi:GNAT superfamily N-acetyltransferase
MLDKRTALDTLRRLDGLSLWLAGGLAVDFYAERWTRDHHDIDLVAFADERERLTDEFRVRGFEMTKDRGWITNWTRNVSLAFEERVDAVTGNLVVRDFTDGVIPGIYPGVPGNLDPRRVRTIDDVSFRVASAEDEWVYTMGFRAFRPGAPVRSHASRQLLESFIADLDALRPRIGLRAPLARTGRVRRRPFSSDIDVVAMQRLASANWPQGRHPGGLAWSVATDQVEDLTLIEDGDELLDFTWREDGAYHTSTTPLEHVMTRCATEDVPPPPDGYHVRSVRDHELAARVDVHRAAWNPHELPWNPEHRPSYPPDARSGHTLEAYHRVRKAWMYDPSLDLVAVAPDGSFAGCCIAWLDPRTAVAEIEPLGVAPAHRRRGVAQALCHEATRRVAQVGGRQLIIGQWPNPAYPAPAGAYAKAGFELHDARAVGDER